MKKNMLILFLFFCINANSQLYINDGSIEFEMRINTKFHSFLQITSTLLLKIIKLYINFPAVMKKASCPGIITTTKTTIYGTVIMRMAHLQIRNLCLTTPICSATH